MSNKQYTAQIVAWNWVVEALSNSQVDTSSLIDLLTKNPEISGDLGKDAREMVSFRILEKLFVSGNEATNDPRVRIDPSEKCADILTRIMTEHMPGPNLIADLKKSKWDVQPFIKHKSSNLPKCGLQKLKEAFFKGRHPRLVSLKQSSGLVDADKCETVDPVIATGLNAETTVAREELISEEGGNRDDEFQADCLNSNLLHSKRARDLTFTAIPGDHSHKSQVTVEDSTHSDVSNPAKKHKKDALCTELTLDPDTDSSGKLAPHVGRNESGLLNEPLIEGLEVNRLPEVSLDVSVASKKLAESSDVDVILHDQQQIPCNEDEVPLNTSGERLSVDNSKEKGDLDETIKLASDVNIQDNHEECFHPNAINDEPDICSDKNGYDDEMTDIASRKRVFLSSQLTQTHDSMETTDWTEVNLCMKCSQGGDLLICNSDSCPIRVHGSCLRSAATFDASGKFYCPFCAYSQVISKFMQVKKNVSFARRNLGAFISYKVESRPMKSSERSSGLVQDQSEKDEHLVTNNDVNNDVNKESDVNLARSSQLKGNTVLADASVLSIDCNPSCQRGADLTNGEQSSGLGDEQGGQKSGKECHSTKRMEHSGTSDKNIGDCVPNTCSSKGRKTSLESEEHAEAQMQNGVLNQPLTDLQPEPVCSRGTSRGNIITEENLKSIASGYSVRLRQQTPPYLSPEPLQQRRNTPKWTKLEEDVLKEGVLKIPLNDDGRIPWKKILEFGSNVFQSGRTTQDLKNKWTRICKCKHV